MGKGWYIVQTYAGYEQRIVDTINKLRRRDEDFAKVCTGVDLPVEEATVKNEKNEVKTVYNKILPGYILVELDFGDGTTSHGSKAQDDATHTYSQPGVY